MAKNNKAHINLMRDHKAHTAICAPATSLSLYSRYFAMLLGLAILWLCTLQSPALKEAFTQAATELFIGSANAMGSNIENAPDLNEPISCGPLTDAEQPKKSDIDPEMIETLISLEMGVLSQKHNAQNQAYLNSPIMVIWKKQMRGETLTPTEIQTMRLGQKQIQVFTDPTLASVLKSDDTKSDTTNNKDDDNRNLMLSLFSSMGTKDFAANLSSTIAPPGKTLSAEKQAALNQAIAKLNALNDQVKACPAPITCGPLTAAEMGYPNSTKPADIIPTLNASTPNLTPFDNQTMRLYLAQKKILKEGGVDVDVLADNIKNFKKDEIESKEFINKINGAYGTNGFADALKSAIDHFNQYDDSGFFNFGTKKFILLTEDQKKAMPGIYQKLKDLNFATCDGQVMACAPFTVDQFNKLNNTTLAFKPGDTSDPDLGIFLGNLDTNAKNFGISPQNTLLFKRWAQNKLDNADHQKFQLLFTQISILQRWVVLGTLTQNNQLSETLINQISATMGTQGLGKTLKDNVTLSALPPIHRMGIQQAIRELDALQMPYCRATISCDPLTKDEINKDIVSGYTPPEVMTFEPGKGTPEQLTALDKAIDDKFKPAPTTGGSSLSLPFQSKVADALKREARGTATPEDHRFLRLYKKQYIGSFGILLTAPEKVKAAKGEAAANQFMVDAFNDIGTVQYPNSLKAALETYGLNAADYQLTLDVLGKIEMNPTCPPPPAVEQKVNLMLEVLQKDPISCAPFTTSEIGMINPSQSAQTAEQENMDLIFAQLFASMAKADSLVMIQQNTQAKLKAGTATAADAQAWRVYNQLVTGGVMFETKINEGKAAGKASRWSYRFALSGNRDDYLKSMQAAITTNRTDLTQDQISTLNGIITRLSIQTTATCPAGVTPPVPTLTPKPLGCGPIEEGEPFFVEKVTPDKFAAKDAEIDAESANFSDKANAIRKRMIRGQDTPADRAFWRLYNLDLAFAEGVMILVLDLSQVKERFQKNKIKSELAFYGNEESFATLGTDAFPDAHATAITNAFGPLSSDEQGRLARGVAYLKTIKIDPACGTVTDVAKPAPVVPPVVAPTPVPPIAAPAPQPPIAAPAPQPPVAAPAPQPPVAAPAPSPTPAPVAAPAAAAGPCPQLTREEVFIILNRPLSSVATPRPGQPESAYTQFDKNINPNTYPINKRKIGNFTAYELLQRAARGTLTPEDNQALRLYREQKPIVGSSQKYLTKAHETKVKASLDSNPIDPIPGIGTPGFVDNVKSTLGLDDNHAFVKALKRLGACGVQ